ncbi:substrate-binding domain-containing protein [Alkaliflexus imshenetskii]|uniref:substrate-binding domain-containing protein n=1 Tax=Alkaliflexus imshenetskii TaxID=286730 RepID=UPI000A00EDE9|nr:substrate-binding domain-containing protein [Alkaliflexus imshenetskii]
MMKHLLLLCLLALMFLFAGCKTDSQFTVAYLTPSENRVRFVEEGQAMGQRFRELGVNFSIVYAGDDDALQIQQGLDLIERGVDALVITAVNGNTIAPLIREAKEKGVMVVAYNRLINNSEYDLFYAGDNGHMAKAFVDAAVSRAPRGNYVILGGDRFDRNGVELMYHIDSLMLPHIESGRINLLYSTFLEGWSRSRAAFEVQQVIDAHGSDIDAIIACNDAMGLGALDVLQANNLQGKVVVTGQGAELESIRNVHRGFQTVTIYHPPKELGSKAAELVYEMLNGRSASQIANAHSFNGLAVIPTFQMKSIVVNRDNLQYLVDAGVFTWNQIQE